MSIAVEVEIDKSKTENFSDLCKTVWCVSMEIGRELIRQALEKADDELREKRDKSRYRNKGKKLTSIKTKFGVVAYRRSVYEDKAAPERNRYVYLLDEALGLKTCGQMSEEVCQMAVREACASSYREAAKEISEMTGLAISAQGVWNIVQEQGEKRRKQLERFKELNQADASPGTIESSLIYEENDGVWLPLQGKDRQKYGNKKEMKVGTAYDGETWEKMKGGKKRRTLHDKVAHASFESAEEFRKTKEGLIGSRYNTDYAKVRIIGGDGAGWTLKPSMKPSILRESGVQVITVLDKFHRNKKITECVQDAEFAALLRKKLYAKDVDTVLALIEARINSVEEENEKSKLQELLLYFTDNKDSLLGYYDRGIDIPETVEPGVVHHALLGSMESNVFTLIGNRMKGRRHCWSINGANNLAALLCLKHTTGFEDLSQTLAPLPVPEEPEDTGSPISASQVPVTVGKGSDFYCQASLSDQPWLRGFASCLPLSQLRI